MSIVCFASIAIVRLVRMVNVHIIRRTFKSPRSLYLNNMQKDKANLHRLWYNTHPVDSWILEYIHFFKNDWGQKVMVGSCLLTTHTDDTDADIIRYDRAPGYGENFNDQAIFVIHYYSETCHLRFPNNKNSQVLEYAEPTFFDRLNAFIWNARSLDYIVADLSAIANDMERMKNKLLDHPMAITKRIGMVQHLLEKTGRWKEQIEKSTNVFCNNDNDISSNPTFFVDVESNNDQF